MCLGFLLPIIAPVLHYLRAVGMFNNPGESEKCSRFLPPRKKFFPIHSSIRNIDEWCYRPLTFKKLAKPSLRLGGRALTKNIKHNPVYGFRDGILVMDNDLPLID